jgi:hypothetical protein
MIAILSSGGIRAYREDGVAGSSSLVSSDRLSCGGGDEDDVEREEEEGVNRRLVRTWRRVGKVSTVAYCKLGDNQFIDPRLITCSTNVFEQSN